MEKILIVSKNEKRTEVYQELISNLLPADFCCAPTGGKAYRLLMENPFSAVVILAPLEDEFGENIAKTAAKTNAGVLLVVKPEAYEPIRQKIRDFGVFLFTPEMGRRVFGYAMDMLMALHRRLAAGAPQTEMLQQKIKDIRTVDRAKCLLIQYSKMTEEEAHRFIEQQSMQKRVSQREIAEKILETYDI